MSTTFHLIRSVKGGSGKTTFALHKATELSLEGEQKVLYIDADVHASETMRMLVKKGPEPLSAESNCLFYSFDDADIECVSDALNGELSPRHHLHTLNSYMHPYRGYFSELSVLPIHATLYSTDQNNKTDEKGQTNFIFCDPTPLGRAVFENIYQSHGKSVIGVGAYIAKMKLLLKFVVTQGYSNVVIDMPPGSDVFSSHLVETLIDYVSSESDAILKIYYVTTEDRAHMLSSAQTAIEHLHVMRSCSPLEVIYVMNNDSSQPPTLKSKKDVLTALKGHLVADMQFDLNRLEYKRMDRDTNYYNSLRKKADANQTILFDLSSKIKSLT